MGEATFECHDCGTDVPKSEVETGTFTEEVEHVHDNGKDPGVPGYRVYERETRQEPYKAPVCPDCAEGVA